MILLIDSYDSFSNNLSQLLSQETGKEVICIYNDSIKQDEYQDFFNQYLRLFEYIVIGPGPGHPKNPSDVGIISHMIRYLKSSDACQRVPILGICLGFQCLCYEFGCSISRLEAIRHGQIYNVTPEECDDILYLDKQGIECVRYHSLYVKDTSDEIVPLAYCLDATENGTEEKSILMACKHIEFPFYGVQYHPESICSHGGDLLIRNFDKVAKKYNDTYRANRLNNVGQDEKKALINELHNINSMKEEFLIQGGKFEMKAVPDMYIKKFQLSSEDNTQILPLNLTDYFYKRDKRCNFIFLNSASVPGDWSIIGCLYENETTIFTHSVDSADLIDVQKYRSNDSRKIELKEKGMWSFLGNQMKRNYINRDILKEQFGEIHHRELPFFGGLMGFISYEEGQNIDADKSNSICASQFETPDTKLAFIDKCILFDHKSNDWFVISINAEAQTWGKETVEDILTANNEGKLRSSFDDVPHNVSDFENISKEEIGIELPDKDIYKKQFGLCQEYLKSGDSYELCLTTQSIVRIPSSVKSWEIYKVLSLRRNPAPYSCFMDFEDCSLISSSPERFLSWKDNANNTKSVELRPIKGTVRKGPGVDFAYADRVLNTPKEKGENLMIVDLIRHDLHRFTKNVEVSQLMSIEEYKTVYQLVSVIEGELPPSGYHGVDVLHMSLPPGSMTGAPKKRSVELLKSIEALQPTSPPDGRRGIYSGIAGFWSVTDDADWSVIIRSIFSYSHDITNTSPACQKASCSSCSAQASKDTTVWRIGAGGAITILSECDAEWDEMETKLSSTLQVFTDV